MGHRRDRPAAAIAVRQWRRLVCALLLGVGLGLAAVPQAGAFVYWSDRGAVGGFGTGSTIGRASQDGTGVTDRLVTVAKGPVGVAVSGTSIYWANTFDLTTSAIGRANVNGTGAVPAFIPQGSSKFPCGVAVYGNYIYWANSVHAGTIGRATLDGTVVQPNFIPVGVNQPCGIAVDGTHIYWANEFSGPSDSPGTTIGRATLDGLVIEPNFIPGAAQPAGVAVSAGRLYWANENGVNTIGRADIGGVMPSGVTQSFAPTGADPCGVAVDAGHVYWGNLDAGSIGRATLDGNPANTTQSFVTGLNHPCGVAVDSLLRSTTTSVSCASPVTVGRPTTCRLTVTDTDAAPASAPSGRVSLSSDTAGGSFSSGGACALGPGSSAGQSVCSVTYTPGQAGSGLQHILAQYAGDLDHSLSAGSGPVTVQTPPPTITRLRQSHRIWSQAKVRKPKHPIGTTFSFTLSAPARVTLVFTQRVGGRRVRGRCVAQSRTNAHARACKRTVTRGTLGSALKAGPNKLAFRGVGHPRLAPGSYTVTFTATSATRQRSTPHALGFTIVR